MSEREKKYGRESETDWERERQKALLRSLAMSRKHHSFILLLVSLWIFKRQSSKDESLRFESHRLLDFFFFVRWDFVVGKLACQDDSAASREVFRLLLY